MANNDPKALPLDEKTYLMGRDSSAPLGAEQRANMELLLQRVNLVFNTLAPTLKSFYQGITSGYRPDAVNSQVKGSAKKSAHTTCQAVDLYDPQKKLAEFLLTHQDILAKAGLYMENPSATKDWVHLTTRATLRRVFIPF